MRGLCCLVLALMVAREAAAHPGPGIAVGRDGRVYFVAADGIRVVDRSGRASYFVRDERLRILHHLVIDAQGNLYTTSDDDGRVWKVTPDGRLIQLYAPSVKTGYVMVGLYGDPFTVSPDGTIYGVGGPHRSRLLRISPDGAITPLAGSDTGYADGPAASARFHDLHYSAMALGPDGSLFVTDRTRIRRVRPDGMVSTVGIHGGPALGHVVGIVVDSAGALCVADYQARRVWRITPGGAAHAPGSEHASFAGPLGVALGSAGALYVLDWSGRGTRIWRLADGTARVVYRSTSLDPRTAVLALLVLLVVLVTWRWATRRMARRPV